MNDRVSNVRVVERSAEVKEHERRAAVILDGMYQFVALLNLSGDILEVNRAALEGVGHEIEEIRGKPFWTARWWQVSKQIQEDLKAAIRRAAAGEFVRYEVDIYGEQSGLAPITIDFSLQPIRGKSGEVEYLLPEGRNITERKRAEEKVQSSEAELRDFVENANIGLHRVDADGMILWANQRELDLLGYAREEYIGHPIAQFHVDPSVCEDILTRLRRGERVLDCEARMRCKDSSTRHVLINSSGFFEHGNFIHSRCFTQDITERKWAQGATALLSAIVDSSDDAIISKDLDGTITSWNKSAERLFGYTASEAVGRSITMLIPPDRLDEEPKILERLKRGERVDHFETTRMRKDGSLLDISLTISPVKDADGRIVGASKVARDITDRKLIERQRQDLSRELEKQVFERTAELREANRALLKDMEKRQELEEQLRQSQKLESMGVLAAGVAHDLNNLLNIIQGYASVLDPGATSEEIGESVGAIAETTKRGTGLVQQLLALARKTEIKMELVDVNTLIEGLSNLIKGTFPKNIEITRDLAPNPLTIMADASQITQVLLNLCVNARDAMPNGGRLALKASIEDGKDLEVYGGLHAEGYVSIEICDTGMGMDESVQDRIFEPFFTTKEIGKGTGLGLAVVYGIVKSHNGFIQLKSQPLHGTTFRVCFPAFSAGA